MYAFFISKDTFFQSDKLHFSIPRRNGYFVQTTHNFELRNFSKANFIQQYLIIILIRLQICIYKKLE